MTWFLLGGIKYTSLINFRYNIRLQSLQYSKLNDRNLKLNGHKLVWY
ncbi:MAG: hypothetical protein JWR61_2574 [Ferruginibacter sp.]|nr:hypothetical protein [Ferruginibacter sp.]